MSRNHPGYEIVPFPKVRRLVIDAARMGRRKNIIHGLIEVDVTGARQRLHDHKAQTGEALSFTAFIVTCLGQAVETTRTVHAFQNWRSQLVLFDDVDVNTIIEIEFEDQKFPLAHVIRAANKRTLRDIHDEIRGIQADPRRGTGSRSRQRALSVFLSLPFFVRQFLYRAVMLNPHWLKKSIGTVAVTALGMYGKGGGWGLPIPVYNLTVTLGGIAEKPGVVEGRIEIREYLSVTLSFNHDIVDGAPAARFAQQFKELIESGYGLPEAAAR
jgi:pyruvate/2-oxoglutarate dehydrogenase complex dihydrolipoamide acyltransferase (E2) component